MIIAQVLHALVVIRIRDGLLCSAASRQRQPGQPQSTCPILRRSSHIRIYTLQTCLYDSHQGAAQVLSELWCTIHEKLELCCKQRCLILCIFLPIHSPRVLSCAYCMPSFTWRIMTGCRIKANAMRIISNEPRRVSTRLDVGWLCERP